jgi:hypothetical protein
MNEHFNIGPVHLGSKFEAKDVTVFGGPIVLVKATDSVGTIVLSRLDIQKQVFIDPNPIDASREQMRSLVAAVIEGYRHRQH